MSPFRRTLLLILTVAAAAGAVALSAWQMRRLHARRAANAAVLAGRDLPPLDLGEALRTGTSIDGRRVTARGQFTASREVLLRGRVQSETPGLQVASPFALTTGQWIWVLRGFVPSPDAFTPPDSTPAAPADTVLIEGVIFPFPVTADSGAPRLIGRDTTWQRLDREAMVARLPGAPPFVLHRTGDTIHGGLPPVPLPAMDDGPHLSYAIQWLGIAAAILTFGYLMVWRRTPSQKSDA